MFFSIDLKQEIQVQERRQPDNDKSAADRVRNHVDSNKLQVELESHTPPSSPIVTQNLTPTVNSTTPQTKSKINSVLRRTKVLLTHITKRRFSSSKLTPNKLIDECQNSMKRSSSSNLSNSSSIENFQFPREY